MKRFLILLYGTLNYLMFLGVYLYFIAFVGDFAAPKTVNSGAAASLPGALAINFLLISLFAVQHSVMARRGFKRWWIKIIPQSIERSTFVFITNLILILLMWQWRPLPQVVWSVEHPIASAILYSMFGAGFALAVLSSFLINHFELFGLQQVYREWRQRAFTAPPFQTPWVYKIIRHPMQAGQILGLWAIPLMTSGHLVLALGMTVYIFIGIYFEERDLVRNFGQRYLDYRKEVPKLIPVLKTAKIKRNDGEASPEKAVNTAKASEEAA